MIDQELEEKEYDADVSNDKQINPDACQHRHVSSPESGYLILLLFPGVSLPQTNYEESESRTCDKKHYGQQDREYRHKLRQDIHE